MDERSDQHAFNATPGGATCGGSIAKDMVNYKKIFMNLFFCSMGRTTPDAINIP